MSPTYVTPRTAIKTYLALLLTLLLHLHTLRTPPSPIPTIHIFTTPKPFLGHDNITQLSAIASWRRLTPTPKITLLTPPDFPLPPHLGLPTRPIDTSFLSVPLLPSLLASLQTTAKITILLNTDIHLFPDIHPALSTLHTRHRRFLAVSARRDLASLPTDPSTHISYTRRHGVLHSYGGVDLWAWPSAHPPPQTPHFLFGRGRYDNWLTHEAIATARPVVDITDAVTLAHVTHDHHLVAGLDEHPAAQFWSRSGHFEAVVNAFLAENYGSYEPQLGTVLHAPLKMVRCFERGSLCVMKRHRPGMCRCEHSPFVHNAMADSYVVNGSRVVICGLLSRNVGEPLRKRFQISGKGQGPFGLPLTKEQVLGVVEAKTGQRKVVLVVAEFAERQLVMEIVCAARVTRVFEELVVVALDDAMYQFCVTRGLAVYLREMEEAEDRAHARDLARLSVADELVREGKHVLSLSPGVVPKESLWTYIDGDAEVVIQPPVRGNTSGAIFFARDGGAHVLKNAIQLMRGGERLGLSLARASGARVHVFAARAVRAAEECVGCRAAAVFVAEYERGHEDAQGALERLRGGGGVSHVVSNSFCRYG